MAQTNPVRQLLFEKDLDYAKSQVLIAKKGCSQLAIDTCD